MLRKKTETIYVTDTGRECVVEMMASSHLLNAVGHHIKQLNTLRDLNVFLPAAQVPSPNFGLEWEDKLIETINTLGAELLSRDPNKEINDDE